MIRKKENYFNSSISSVKLYLDDIERMMDILRAENTIIEISDNENIYESINELIGLKGNNPKLVKIAGKYENSVFEYIIITISEYSVSIYTHHSERFLKKAYEIEKFVQSKKRNSIYFLFNSKNSKFNIVFNVIFAIGFYIAHSYIYRKDYNVKVFLYFICFWVLVFIISELNPNSNTKIELKRRYETDFWGNNKDKVILIIITAVVSILITLAVK